MNSKPTCPTASSRARRSILLGLLVVAALALGACQAGTNAVPTLPSLAIPTMPPDDLASNPNACIVAPTMVIIDELRATGADVPALLAANKDALIVGLSRLESSDAGTTAWRDALVGALRSGDAEAAAAEVAKLANDDVTITPC
jgi:hypothetical protein